VLPNYFFGWFQVYEFSRVDNDLYMVNLGLLMFVSEYTQKAQIQDPVNKLKTL